MRLDCTKVSVATLVSAKENWAGNEGYPRVRATIRASSNEPIRRCHLRPRESRAPPSRTRKAWHPRARRVSGLRQTRTAPAQLSPSPFRAEWQHRALARSGRHHRAIARQPGTYCHSGTRKEQAMPRHMLSLDLSDARRIIDAGERKALELRSKPSPLADGLDRFERRELHLTGQAPDVSCVPRYPARAARRYSRAPGAISRTSCASPVRDAPSP
jgi:hypothetical protein